MADLGGFDAGAVEPNKGFDPLPEGKYMCVISKSEEKENSAKTGSFLSLEFTVMDGQFANRKLYANLNLVNPNKTAVKIAMGDLSAICRAVGVLTPKDSSQLHDLPLILKVGLEKRKDTGGIQNKIKGYEARPSANAGGASSAVPSPTPSNPAQPGSPAPWARK